MLPLLLSAVFLGHGQTIQGNSADFVGWDLMRLRERPVLGKAAKGTNGNWYLSELGNEGEVDELLTIGVNFGTAGNINFLPLDDTRYLVSYDRLGQTRGIVVATCSFDCSNGI